MTAGLPRPADRPMQHVRQPYARIDTTQHHTIICQPSTPYVLVNWYRRYYVSGAYCATPTSSHERKWPQTTDRVSARGNPNAAVRYTTCVLQYIYTSTGVPVLYQYHICYMDTALRMPIAIYMARHQVVRSGSSIVDDWHTAVRGLRLLWPLWLR